VFSRIRHVEVKTSINLAVKFNGDSMIKRPESKKREDTLEQKMDGREMFFSIARKVITNLNNLKIDITKFLREYKIIQEDAKRMVSLIDECYKCLRQLDYVFRDSSLYFSLRKFIENLTFAYVSIEAYTTGFLSLPLLKMAIQKSGILPQIEKIISQIEIKIE